MSADNIIFIDPNDPRRQEAKPYAKFEILGDLESVLVDGLMPIKLARKVLEIVALYNAGREIRIETDHP